MKAIELVYSNYTGVHECDDLQLMKDMLYMNKKDPSSPVFAVSPRQTHKTQTLVNLVFETLDMSYDRVFVSTLNAVQYREFIYRIRVILSHNNIKHTVTKDTIEFLGITVERFPLQQKIQRVYGNVLPPAICIFDEICYDIRVESKLSHITVQHVVFGATTKSNNGTFDKLRLGDLMDSDYRVYTRHFSETHLDVNRLPDFIRNGFASEFI